MTIEGTPINIFDDYGVRVDDWAPASSQSPNGALINRPVLANAGTVTAAPQFVTDPSFEAGWAPDGARCLSQTRWSFLTPQLCKVPSMAPFQDVDGYHVCNSVQQARQYYGVDVFNESDHFPLPPEWGPVQLSVTRQAVGGAIGKITSVPAGIDCGTDCSQMYKQYTTIRLKGPSGPDIHWTGCTAVQGNECVVEMRNAPKSVTAKLICEPGCYANCLADCLDGGGRHALCVPACRAQCRNCSG
jgi:hypothetical protein